MKKTSGKTILLGARAPPPGRAVERWRRPGPPPGSEVPRRGWCPAPPPGQWCWRRSGGRARPVRSPMSRMRFAASSCPSPPRAASPRTRSATGPASLSATFWKAASSPRPASTQVVIRSKASGRPRQMMRRRRRASRRSQRNGSSAPSRANTEHAEDHLRTASGCRRPSTTRYGAWHAAQPGRGRIAKNVTSAIGSPAATSVLRVRAMNAGGRAAITRAAQCRRRPAARRGARTAHLARPATAPAASVERRAERASRWAFACWNRQTATAPTARKTKNELRIGRIICSPISRWQ